MAAPEAPSYGDCRTDEAHVGQSSTACAIDVYASRIPSLHHWHLGLIPSS